MKYAIKNMAGDVTGLLCDGANLSCALKTSTGATSAIRAAFLALDNVVVPNNIGIVEPEIEETIRNIGRISSPGMLETDKVVLEIFKTREKNKKGGK
jgi:L-cysteine desulfidase